MYDLSEEGPICAQACVTAAELAFNPICLPINSTQTSHKCSYKYIHASKTTPSQEQIRITYNNSFGDCNSCDLKYNFQYHDYCISNSLMKPFLDYNGFRPMAPHLGSHFADLKFIAFFCLKLKNSTACNHLANLCVLSHYSLDKHSPCTAFYFAQSTDVGLHAAHVNDLSALQPELFFRKGKESEELIDKPLECLDKFELTNDAAAKEKVSYIC